MKIVSTQNRSFAVKLRSFLGFNIASKVATQKHLGSIENCLTVRCTRLRWQVDLYTGALFIQQSLGWDLYLSIFILIVIVAVLTITGKKPATYPM